ncbi:MAG TPA: M20/M25/M40 family metallo-hydrolase, partial [Mucilaginibacter sp.]|nr:M20/M25/M40 family metallo-hydrolase [Mucilaginibacter sp.]
MQDIKQYVEQNKQRLLDELFELLRFPSVSADPKYKPEVLKTADYVAKKLTDAGADKVEVCQTAGYPIVYGEKLIDPAKPTVLVYGHYDVQPPDPLELWKTPPFEPTVRDGKIYARGACDDKGQFYMHVKAFELMMQNNSLPCNIKFMIEGEEEVGSSNLGIFVKENKERLKADVVLISDTSMISMEHPS